MNSIKPARNNWITLPLVFAVCWVFTYGHRMLLSPLLVSIEKEWFLNYTELGLVSSALFFAYAFMQIPSGLLADRIGRKKLLLAGLFLQSLAVIGTGFSNNIKTFILMRLLTGVGQGTMFASLFSLANNSIPEEKRTLGLGIIHAGMPLGVIYGLSLSSQLTYNAGYPWRTSFIISGLALLLFAVFTVFYIKLNRQTIREPEKIGQKTAPNASGNKLFNRNMVIISICNTLEAYGIFVIFSWLPYYFATKGYSELYAGNITSLLSLLTIPSTVLLALYANKLGRKKPVIMTLMPISIAALFLIVTTEVHWVLIFALLLHGLVGKMTSGPLHIVLIAECTDPARLSTVFGIYNTMGALAMILGPSVTGYLADRTGSIESGLYLAIIFQVIAMIIFFGVREGKENASCSFNEAK